MTIVSHKMRLMAGVTAALMLLPAIAMAQQVGTEGAELAPESVQPAEFGALRDSLASEFGSDSDVLSAYLARQFEPIWTDANGGASGLAEALIDAMADAPRHALPATRYGADELSLMAMGLNASTPEVERTEFEVAMTRALIRWAGDLKAGLVQPGEIDRNIKRRTVRPGAGELLADMTAAGDPVQWVAGLAPQTAEYAGLQAGLDQIQAVIASGGWGAEVPKGKTMRLGDRGSRVAALRARLTAMGDMDASIAAGDGTEIAVADTTSDAAQPVGISDPNGFDRGLEAAVRTFQARHGLNTDGVVGPATLAAINITAEERRGRIAVNLERLRWLNRDLGERRVMVNIAGFSMKLIDGDQTIFESRVVVGKPKHQTPEFSDEMEHMVINPSWNVPYSIASKEILPKLRNDPGYLAKNNMELIGAEPWFIDWHAVSPSNFPGRIKQRPGRGNALGTVKFMFPNDNSIYLHDTPSKSLFAKDLRAFSHGCVRVEKPHEFAEILLASQTSNPKATFESLLRSGRERWVNLDEHIPVHIDYRTAWLEDDGTEQYRTDIYGRDAKVLAAMEAAGVSLGL